MAGADPLTPELAAGEPPCGAAELIVIGPGTISRKIKDAVCGRVVDKSAAVVREARDGSRCYFCSQRCLILYYLNPWRYLKKLV